MSNIALDRQKNRNAKDTQLGRQDTPSFMWPCKVPDSPKEGRGRKASPPAFGIGQTVQSTWSGQLQSPVCSSVQGWVGLGGTCSSGMCLSLPI